MKQRRLYFRGMRIEQDGSVIVFFSDGERMYEWITTKNTIAEMQVMLKVKESTLQSMMDVYRRIERALVRISYRIYGDKVYYKVRDILRHANVKKNILVRYADIKGFEIKKVGRKYMLLIRKDTWEKMMGYR